MELDRPHFRTTSTCTTTKSTSSELFICFSSRPSSSMKLTKSILSPGRAARDGCAGPASLSSSLSRRLRTNGSLKGGASPFFTSSAKKRGCGFDNPEPSSPKVTCIGQVRVKSLKSKKKVRQTRSLSTRSGEVSFRKIEQQGQGNSSHFHRPPQNKECFPNRDHNNQRWAHLPISICEALRSFGSEISCLFPCKSPYFSSCEKGEEKRNRSDEDGCGAVFTRLSISVNDGEGGKRREIELVVGGGDEEVVVEEERRMSMNMKSSRRHVFEDIEVKDDRIEMKGQSCYEDERGGEQVEKGRVSICVPPKNALLLMRCRSDPMKVAALASRFSWDAHAAPRASNCENGADLEDEEQEVQRRCHGIEEFERECGGKDVIYEEGRDFEQAVGISSECNEEMPSEAKVVDFEMEVRDGGGHEEQQVLEVEMVEEDEVCDELQREIGEETFVEGDGNGEEEVDSNISSFEAMSDQENADQGSEECPIQETEQVTESHICHFSPSPESEQEEQKIESGSELAAPVLRVEAPLEKLEKDAIPDEKNELETEPEEETYQEYKEIRANKLPESQKLGILNLKKEKEIPKALPDCLLLMMCEPKLSMEVSKETWVCSTDFIRWLPERPPKQQQPQPKSGGGGGCNHQPSKRKLSRDSKHKNLEKIDTDQRQTVQPPRSSCSLPPKAPSMATRIEQKLVNAAAYEPFVLTRCKSEPMRTAAAKLMPDSFFWKNSIRNLEPHRRATVGAAGAGF